ncbi:MAG: hypothetical protein NTZ83_02620, partial [Candidatus Pacearchaeota archaeon]|nr:hypothetical protein [Candidatus Pacearchaeota archaeon]
MLKHNTDDISLLRALEHLQYAIWGARLTNGLVIPGYRDIIESENFSYDYKQAARHNLKLAYLNMAQIYEALKLLGDTEMDYPENVIRCYEEAIKENSQDIDLRAEFIIFLLKEGISYKLSEQARYFNQSIEGELKLGWIYLNMQYYESAKEQAYSVLSQELENIDAHYILLTIYFILNDPEKFIKEVEYLISNAPLKNKLEICNFLIGNFEIFHIALLRSKKIKYILTKAISAYPSQHVWGKLLIKLQEATETRIKYLEEKQGLVNEQINLYENNLKCCALTHPQATIPERTEIVLKTYNHILKNGIRGSPEILISLFCASCPINYPLRIALKQIASQIKRRLEFSEPEKLKLFLRKISEVNDFELYPQTKEELLQIYTIVQREITRQNRHISGRLFIILMLFVFGGIIWHIFTGGDNSNTSIATGLLLGSLKLSGISNWEIFSVTEEEKEKFERNIMQFLNSKIANIKDIKVIPKIKATIGRVSAYKPEYLRREAVRVLSAFAKGRYAGVFKLVGNSIIVDAAVLQEKNLVTESSRNTLPKEGIVPIPFSLLRNEHLGNISSIIRGYASFEELTEKDIGDLLSAIEEWELLMRGLSECKPYTAATPLNGPDNLSDPAKHGRYRGIYSGLDLIQNARIYSPQDNLGSGCFVPDYFNSRSMYFRGGKRKQQELEGQPLLPGFAVQPEEKSQVQPKVLPKPEVSQGDEETKPAYPKNVWREDGVEVFVSQLRYTVPAKTKRPILVKGKPSEYRLLWKAFGGEGHKIKTELEDRRWAIVSKVLLSEAIKSVEKSNYQLSEEERKDISVNIDKIISAMVKPRGRLKVDEKALVKILKDAIRQLTEEVERPEKTLIELLNNAIKNLELRKQATEKMIQRPLKNLRELKIITDQRDDRVLEEAEKIEELISMGLFNEACRKMTEMMRAADIIEKDRTKFRKMQHFIGLTKEPEYEIHLLLNPAMRVLGKNDTKGAIFELEILKKKARDSLFLHELLVRYFEALVKAEMSFTEPIEQNQLLKELLLEVSEHPELFAKYPEVLRKLLQNYSNSLKTNVMQQAIWWAKIYRAVNISLNSPTFKAAAKYIYILEFDYIEEILRKKRILPKNIRIFLEHIQVERIKNKQIIEKDGEAKTFLIDQDLELLLKAIAIDFEFDNEQSKELRGCVWSEETGEATPPIKQDRDLSRSPETKTKEGSRSSEKQRGREA